ncbi:MULTISPECIES: hypothetical protein [Acetivibrio]|uniref:hypothetical protein n=1 Tax=Acetivibrio TaxID=35829 RepID=UPI0001C146D2|nr:MULTISPECIES: hypothetical protein [Acetivibrio]THJ78028.1 hypothetical protein EPD62_08190 [Acetivibrio thermocellus]UWV46608.1 hypothetical protein N1236_13775 [Acetivibrio thermocellus]
MIDLIKLEITRTKFIKIYLPCEKKNIKPFDIISIKYLKDQIEYDLYVDDFATEAIQILKNLLKKALNFDLQIQRKYIDKGIGYYYNIYANELWTTDDENVIQSLVDPSQNFSLWSTPTHIGIETFMYNIDDKIYIEISPIYKWNCDYPENESEYETFDNFLNNYKPIDIVSIDRSVAERWLDFCCDMIKIFKENDKKYLKEDNTN